MGVLKNKFLLLEVTKNIGWDFSLPKQFNFEGSYTVVEQHNISFPISWKEKETMEIITIVFLKQIFSLPQPEMKERRKRGGTRKEIIPLPPEPTSVPVGIINHRRRRQEKGAFLVRRGPSKRPPTMRKKGGGGR